TNVVSSSTNSAPSDTNSIPSGANDGDELNTNDVRNVRRVVQTTEDNITAYIQISADNDVAEEFGKTFAGCFYVGEVIIENKNTKTFLAYGASVDVNVAYYVSESDWIKN